MTEEHPLVPLTDYNKYKGLCEPILLRHQSPEFTSVIIRPATVCGYSPRMRFDLTVNILTNHAYNNGVITIFGGNQKRPNIHIDDICELYVELLTMPAEKIAGETFNAGYQNQTVAELAEIAKQIVEEECRRRTRFASNARPVTTSARTTSRRGRSPQRLGWAPKRTIEDAVRDLCRAFKPESSRATH